MGVLKFIGFSGGKNAIFFNHLNQNIMPTKTGGEITNDTLSRTNNYLP